MSNIRPAPIFIADAKGLDFLNSLATPVDTPVEWLGSGDDLLAWLKAADLVPTDVLKTLKAGALPGELDAVAAQARSLREWFRGFVRKHKGRALKPSALQQLDPLNRILERDEVFGQVAPRDQNTTVTQGSFLMWVEQRRWRSPESLLQPIAREMANVICNEDFNLVRACEGHACTLMFVDRTKSHRRRWCSMAVCGNRAKQAALRERSR
ncbi:CGNR zinc finger domain-containing protein [Hyphomicrobium sp. 2TAF46]|uniref:CGNR zinc finger domain-containing protein n=1 Tax=Hyphomicrobium sp. 2TAF46 TaxID=3233019 RepID=UPI003F932E22